MLRFHKKLSEICQLHYIKLVYRSLLFVVSVALYLYGRLVRQEDLFEQMYLKPWVMVVIWVVFVVEMVLRFLPSQWESMGCQKQFSKNYRPKETHMDLTPPNSFWSTFAVAVAWLGLNGIIGLLYYLHIIDREILLLICLAYSVCDMICILFFCPFQTWFMKNKCCTTCRIYNWDYAMMFTPMVFIPHVFSWSLLFFALLLLLRWELTFRKHPEYFMERTNCSLVCANCQEKLCHHKKQLLTLWKKIKKDEK